ncbi:MAG: helix-turn-helix domain-containing protein [Planctomycetota bacterium]|nr:MAG: helix-turn-helix domain-containing protein [Planctomycetota bacterium]
MSELRKTVSYLTTLRCNWSAEECAQLANTALPATKAYLAKMLQEGVVVQDDEWYRAGDAAPEWRKKKTKTRPGGHARMYLAAKALREDLIQRDWQQSMRQGKLLTRHKKTIADNVRQHKPNDAERDHMDIQELSGEAISPSQAAQSLSVSVRTIHRWRKKGLIKAVQITPGTIRIPVSEMKRLVG